MKVCSVCKVEKDFGEFYKNARRKDGLKSQCKDCEKKYLQKNKERIAKQKNEYNQKNKEKILEWQRKYRKNNRERITVYKRKYLQNNRDKNLEWQRKYRKNNKESIVKRMKEWRETNKDDIVKYKKKYYQENKDTVLKDYYQRNKESIAKQSKKYYQENKEKIVKRAKEHKQRNPLLSQSQILCGSARGRSRKNKTPIDLDFISKPNIMEWLKHQSRCELCNIEFSIGYKGKSGGRSNSPSLDRLIPSLGYVPGNVSLICFRCNAKKSDATFEEYERMYYWWKNKLNKKLNPPNLYPYLVIAEPINN